MKPFTPIEHVVVIVKKNHTFDNYFGTFPGVNGDSKLAHAPDHPSHDPPAHSSVTGRASAALCSVHLRKKPTSRRHFTHT